VRRYRAAWPRWLINACLPSAALPLSSRLATAALYRHFFVIFSMLYTLSSRAHLPSRIAYAFSLDIFSARAHLALRIATAAAATCRSTG